MLQSLMKIEINFLEVDKRCKFDAIILAVAHDKFNDLDIDKITNGNRVVYDVKGVLSEGVIDGKL